MDEVKSNIEEIKSQGILDKWSIVHLLDGWVMGFDYEYELKQGYKSSMSDILVVNVKISRPSDGTFDPDLYSGVEFSDQGREAAMLLSCDDHITEVIHFILYLFKKDEERLAELDKLILMIKTDLGCNC